MTLYSKNFQPYLCINCFNKPFSLILNLHSILMRLSIKSSSNCDILKDSNFNCYCTIISTYALTCQNIKCHMKKVQEEILLQKTRLIQKKGIKHLRDQGLNKLLKHINLVRKHISCSKLLVSIPRLSFNVSVIQIDPTIP